jgi:hypothetical protein
MNSQQEIEPSEGKVEHKAEIGLNGRIACKEKWN